MSKIEKLQKKIDELQKELDEFKEQEKKKETERVDVWKPKLGEGYWYIDSCGYVFYTINAFKQEDKKRFFVGNVFKTREEAEFIVEKLKVLTELRAFAEPKDMEWDGGRKHWEIVYESTLDRVQTVNWLSCRTNGIHFETEEKAQKAIDAVGEDRIKKYYLEVE